MKENTDNYTNQKMSRKRALNILELKKNETQKEVIKKQYHILALKYHPDKNIGSDKNAEACAKFQQIHEAYVFLSKEENDQEPTEYTETTTTYHNYLLAFIKVLFPNFEQQEIAVQICEIVCNKLYNQIRNAVYNGVYNEVKEKTIEKLLEYLEKVDRRLLKVVYTVINKYQQILNIDADFLEKIGHLLQNKYAKDEKIILNPTLKDLFEANLYKLIIGNSVFLVPLWHHELVYDIIDNDIKSELYVECIPKLPENVNIDEHNNLHINMTYELTEIWSKTYIEYIVEGIGSLFTYPVENLNIVPTQTRILNSKLYSIPRINSEDIYDINKKGNIYLHISIT